MIHGGQDLPKEDSKPGSLMGSRKGSTTSSVGTDTESQLPSSSKKMFHTTESLIEKTFKTCYFWDLLIVTIIFQFLSHKPKLLTVVEERDDLEVAQVLVAEESRSN